MFEDSSQISRSAEVMLESLLESKAKDAFGVPEVLDSIMDKTQKMDGLPVTYDGDVPRDVSTRSLVTDSGTQLFELMPSGSSDSDLTMVFYHGGGFIMEIAEPHWNFCFELVRTLRCRIIVAIYPLAPVHTYEDAYIACYDAFSYASSLSDDSKLILIGDSAGAHLAIAMAQIALNKGVRQPNLVIAISPWIDIADEVEGKDGIDPHRSDARDERLKQDCRNMGAILARCKGFPSVHSSRSARRAGTDDDLLRYPRGVSS